MSPGLSIATSKSEKPTAADDRHLPHPREYCVSSQDTETTAVIFAIHERKSQRHQESHFLLRRRCIYSLRSSYKLGAGFGSHSQRIVHHKHRAEKRRRFVGHGSVGDFHGGGFCAGDDVMEVEVEVAELLCLEAHPFGRKVSGEMVGFLAGTGSYDDGNGGEEEAEKDEEFCHGGEETTIKSFVCQLGRPYLLLNIGNRSSPIILNIGLFECIQLFMMCLKF